MSYAQRKELSGNRTLAIIMVVFLQFALGYAIVTGLAYNVIKKAAQDLKTFDVEEQPPPPEEPPPPPKDMPDVPPPPVTPPPLVRMEAPPPRKKGAAAPHPRVALPPLVRMEGPPPPIQTVTAPPPPVYIPPVAPAPPAPPPPPRKVQSAQSAKGDLRSLFSTDDYPASASAAEAQGTAQAQLTISPSGQVVGCNLIRSPGNGARASATCNTLRRRAKFTPARNSNGNATTDTITTPPIVWRLEG